MIQMMKIQQVFIAKKCKVVTSKVHDQEVEEGDIGNIELLGRIVEKTETTCER